MLSVRHGSGLHSLPWPEAELQALGEAQVEMRVTLSYFIEPKPGRRGGFTRARHRYQSHGLRFQVKRAQESLDDFRQRINKAARDEEDDYAGPLGDPSGWDAETVKKYDDLTNQIAEIEGQQ